MYHLRLKGDHYQMGVKRGKIFQKNNIIFPLHLDNFQLEHGRKSEQILKEFFPEVCEEIRGVSDTVGVSYALLLLMKLPVASNCNILIADKNGEMIVVECTPYEKRIRKAVSMDNGKIVCTVNSFTSDEMKRHDAAKGNDYHSAKRYDTVMESFSTHIKGNLIEATEQLLKGDYGFMCQYDEPDFETVWSSVFDLKNLMIYRAEGNPRKKKFVVDSRLHDVVQRK